jgi:hypothetical protein
MGRCAAIRQPVNNELANAAHDVVPGLGRSGAKETMPMKVTTRNTRASCGRMRTDSSRSSAGRTMHALVETALRPPKAEIPCTPGACSLNRMERNWAAYGYVH